MNNIINLFVKAGNDFGEKVSSLTEQVWAIAGIIIPVLAGLAGVFAIFKLVQLGIKLSQSGDDPEERSHAIKAIIWWGVGLLICIAAATIAPSVIFTIFGDISNIEFGKN
ncbi:MAG: Mbov_0395 family pilin-like conjugal transfer protein [Metamycoplasmataceae bacterium]